MNDIKSAPAKRIAEYLNHLYDLAYEKSNGDDDEIWTSLFNAVFRPEVSGVIYEKYPDFNPYIPDTSYQEDVCSFIFEFDRYAYGNGNNGMVFPTFEEYESTFNIY